MNKKKKIQKNTIQNKKNNKNPKVTKKVKRKMPGEIKLDQIIIGMECRTYLQWYYSAGGNEFEIGVFKGKVLKINKKGILFNELFIEFDELSGDVITGKEDHIWILDAKPFIDAKIKVNDCVQFNAIAYAYKRKDDSIDFSLKESQNIKKIQSYELPSDEYLRQKSKERLECELCLFADHCDGVYCLKE